MENKIEFIGYVESGDGFMLGQKYLGAAMCEGRGLVGMITGKIDDLWDGHVWPSITAIEHVEGFLKYLCDNIENPSYKLTKCTYKEACKVVLDSYPQSDTIKWKVNNQTIEFDVTKVKNQLKAIVDEQA
ncbi:MAG TPA: hypothetical protein PLP63_06410 [Saprospiraceae bacterium]|nr:hypothetical protein [Saprospiraceae bacterium]